MGQIICTIYDLENQPIFWQNNINSCYLLKSQRLQNFFDNILIDNNVPSLNLKKPFLNLKLLYKFKKVIFSDYYEIENY